MYVRFVLLHASCTSVLDDTCAPAGGYTTGSQELIDLLRNRSRPYLFSNTLPPAVVAIASKVTANRCRYC